ncbi:hypothetical protein [Micromonospora sp. CPCC 206061]|uniref:hypothetical protein n=1 Tax=Micromonospora sp. CPCC 206061 TaxID=3122410 RepID=UPI002FF42879
MFAPDPYAMAAELVRVCAPGGVIAVLARTPDSPFGQQADIAFRHLPPASAVGRPRFEAWGDPAMIREFFTGQPADIATTVDSVDVHWPSLEAAVDEVTTLVPGWVAAHTPLEAAGAWSQAQADVTQVFASAGHTDDTGFVLPVQYLTTLARRV